MVLAFQAARPDGGSRTAPYKFASDETPAFFEVAWMICATVWHALSLRPPAPAFEDREVPLYVRPSRERFEAKPQQKKLDYN